MKDMKTKDKPAEFADPTDRMLAERLAPLRETVIADEGFSLRVRRSLPRRDVSLWVVFAAIAGGVGATVGVIGWAGCLELFQAFAAFFADLRQMHMPSAMSLISVAAITAVLGFAMYAMLDTDDYQGAADSGD